VARLSLPNTNNASALLAAVTKASTARGSGPGRREDEAFEARCMDDWRTHGTPEKKG
jgi:hypothetical protein